jgi:hypothetical protein
MENHGTRFERRWKVLRERVLAMKTIGRIAFTGVHTD